eukprot:GHVU01062164.1.p1 GENE.GHVU01062164.1~~GHVU01062164.1.p1  ORF type:complete len:315 (+),score=53.86 GHVU01062164.1:122-1066(+)
MSVCSEHPPAKATDFDQDQGYASGSSSHSYGTQVPLISFTKAHLKFLNQQLADKQPIDILRWAILTLPNLYQTTALGLTGLATLDMLQKLQTESPSAPKIDQIFLDTLHHFQETLDLIENIKAQYPNVHFHIYKPDGCETEKQFAEKHGKNLWETNDTLYDWVAKVEPAQRAYSDLSVAAVLTGRRRSQGANRASLDIIEVDEFGLVKVNPMANWSYDQVADYIQENNVPYNALLSQGYKSIGDWHSTVPVAAGEDERAGRWKGTKKTECGIHNKPSKYAMYLKEMERKQKEEERRLAAVDEISEATSHIAISA